ncbi:alpha-internexin [Orussus abietinus]|uniref:alpha-internexin n=1 Tax=Orussus abietinus TaxID=222816 RepID=UPI000C7162A4|nr:alpha-internexin [Orussus abietinus]
MPETASAPKTEPSPGVAGKEAAGHRTEGSEEVQMQCLRRKPRYSQLPVRCQTHPYRRPAPPRSPFTAAGDSPDPKVFRSPCPPGFCFRVPGIASRPERSASMVDLSPKMIGAPIAELRSKSSATLRRAVEVEERRLIAPRFEVRVRALRSGAATIVCHSLVLNAWRCRREEAALLQRTAERLGQQVEHLRLQIVVLRRLLETENSRVGRLTSEVHRAKAQLDEATRERDVALAEKNEVLDEVKRLKEAAEEKSVANENLRNELFSSRSQLEGLDAQISRDREKLLKLREDKRILLEKVTASESLAAERGSRAENAERVMEDLQIKLAAQTALAESSREESQRRSRELEAKEAEMQKLERRLRSSEETGRALSLRASNLENQLMDREAALRRIESAYSRQLTELVELKERLVRQSQEVGWSSRVLQLAGSVVRAPRVILRTLSFLSSSGLPLSS